MKLTHHSQAYITMTLLREQLLLGTPNPPELEPEKGEWPCFVAHLPQDPDDAVAIYDTDGLKDGRYMNGGEVVVFEGLQIKVRARRYPDGFTKAKELAHYLDSVLDEPLSIPKIGVLPEENVGYLVHSFTRTAPVVHIGLDPDDNKRRHHFTINATITIEETSP